MYGDQDVAIETYIKNYESLIHIYNTIDIELLGNLVFLTSINIQQDLGKYMLDSHDISSKNLSILMELFYQEISGTESMRNSLKREHIT